MSEETKTTTRGRKPKAQTDPTTENPNVDMLDIIEQMKKQMDEMQKQLDKAKQDKEKATSENLDLQGLVEALQNNNKNNLPNYVTVISLVPNTYNLSTGENGRGTCYSFSDIGDTKIISLNNMQDIMCVSKYRHQAENGYFYIVEDEVNEYFRINRTSHTLDTIQNILQLKTDDCVENFISLNPKLQISLADRMALNISNGDKLDRNKLAEIFDKTGIDIEEKVRNLKKIV